MHYPRTHQLLLRLLLEDFRLARLFTGALHEQIYEIRLEAENGSHDLGIYKNSTAICLLTFTEKLVNIRSRSIDQGWLVREITYANLITVLTTYLNSTTACPHSGNVNVQLAFQYLKSLEVHFPNSEQRLSYILN